MKNFNETATYIINPEFDDYDEYTYQLSRFNDENQDGLYFAKFDCDGEEVGKSYFTDAELNDGVLIEQVAEEETAVAEISDEIETVKIGKTTYVILETEIKKAAPGTIISHYVYTTHKIVNLKKDGMTGTQYKSLIKHDHESQWWLWTQFPKRCDPIFSQ